MEKEYLEELEQAKKNARSMHSGVNKYQLRYLGSYKGRYQNYYYYQDSEGNYWYENDYDRQMEVKEKEKKKQKLRTWRSVA